MSDQDGSPELLHPPLATRPSSESRELEITPRSSHEMGSAGDGRYLADTSLTTPSPSGTASQGQRHSRRINVRDDDRRRRGLNRTHKQRASGAFLLSDPIFNPPGQDSSASGSRKTRNSSEIHSRQKVTQHVQTAQRQRGPETVGGQGVGLGLGLGVPTEPAPKTENKQRRNHTRDATVVHVPKRDSLAGDTVVGSSPRTGMGTLDVESAQIVNMALNLSESRRLASRRNATTPTPPRLTPLPDSTTGGSLRQHLQQQRRVSRTISPKPDRTPRLGSSRIISPLQPGYETEASYKYQFSQSTLARAQKAKEYIELMAQYRRVLEFLPPLVPSRTTRSSTASPPESPNASVQLFKPPSDDVEFRIGRPYNPLQYIRNRKVRARERRAIDGEAQGFKDVVKVSDWVDEVAKWVATGQYRVPGNPTLPPYAIAEAVGGSISSPPSISSRSGATMGKARRPRVDWVIEPADVIADVYWLEQDGNKRLVEDRHWRRVFPQAPAPLRPLSREDAGPITSGPVTATPTTSNDSPATTAPAGNGTPNIQVPKTENEHIFTSARDRAHQKLRVLRGSHHRQNSSINGRDFLRIHRGSLSESSDTDSDRRRRGRTNTISSNGKDILAKQMEAILAREQQNAEGQTPLYDHEALRMKFASALATPEPERPDASRNHSRMGRNRRMETRSELSETEKLGYFKFKTRPSPPQPQTASRASLEVPPSNTRGRRYSFDYDTSQPNSPDLRAARDNTLVPAIGMDLSPTSSRPSSPSRNPLSRMKSHFRDRSRNRAVELSLSEAEDTGEVPAVSLEKLVDSPTTDKSVMTSPERKSSRSPLRKVISRSTDASQTSHRSTGSHKLRHEDGSSGLRGLFRGPRIDSVLRSGVSKVSDIIWRKDRDDDTSSTSSDDSDTEQVRGRPRSSQVQLVQPGQDASTRSGKTYLDVMPHFERTPEHSKSASGDQGGLKVPGSSPSSQPLSRRSSRFEMLKPPKLDVQAASPTSSPTPEPARGYENASDSDSHKSATSFPDGVRAADARLNAVLHQQQQVTQQHDNSRQFPITSQPWSITDRNGNPRPISSVVSRREAARLRARLLSTGIRAREMDRRAKEQRISPVIATTNVTADTTAPSQPFSWADLTTLCTDPVMKSQLSTCPITLTDLYPVAARVLGQSIQSSAQQWQLSSEQFTSETAPRLENRVEQLRGKLAGELTDLTRQAAEDADEAYTDLVTGQRLKVKRVQDFIDKMLRRRRRRFRWVRRAGWLAVEWALVGFMWYVWFVVMIARVLLAVFRGVVGVGRWLLWL
ncbi:hypothetical protein V8F20_000600 [Naviculisporaceae sp. PSN 640]